MRSKLIKILFTILAVCAAILLTYAIFITTGKTRLLAVLCLIFACGGFFCRFMAEKQYANSQPDYQAIFSEGPKAEIHKKNAWERYANLFFIATFFSILQLGRLLSQK